MAAEKAERSSFSLCKTFASNVVKRVNNHNRITVDKSKLRHRSFENELRKKHTQTSLQLSRSNTMYSDLITSTQRSTKSTATKKKVITPFQQIKKLVSDAADFDNVMEKKGQNREKSSFRKGRITLNKTVLMNHLKHTCTHNRLKEEEEMWDQHSKQKKRKIALVTAKNKSARKGTMYSDREPRQTKTHRIIDVEVSDEVEDTTPRKPYFGKYTKQLLEMKEQDKEKWGHSGFKEVYGKEINEKPSVKILRVVEQKSNDNQNIKLRKSKQKSHISLVEDNDCRKVISKAKMKEMSQPKSTKVILKSLHADEIEAEEPRIQNKSKRKFERWGEEEIENSPSKKRIRSFAIQKPNVVDHKKSGDEWEEKGVIVTHVKERLDNDVIIVDRSSLKKSIHEDQEPGKKKSRLILSNKKKEHLRKKQVVDSDNDVEFVKSTRRVIKPKAYASDRESSFTDSSGDERYRKIKKRGKTNTHKSTFSDYDSDFEQR